MASVLQPRLQAFRWTRAVLPSTIAPPCARICPQMPRLEVLRDALVPVGAQSTNDPGWLANVPVKPHPLMHKPGEENPLGKYSPYLPPVQIEGIRRAPRPLEVDPIPGSEDLLKIRPPKPDSPYAEYGKDIGKIHSYWDRYVGSLTPMLYVMGFIALVGSFHDLTFIEFVHILDRL